MALERDFIQPLHLALELHAKDLAPPRPDGIANLIDSTSAAATSHVGILPQFTILLARETHTHHHDADFAFLARRGQRSVHVNPQHRRHAHARHRLRRLESITARPVLSPPSHYA